MSFDKSLEHTLAYETLVQSLPNPGDTCPYDALKAAIGKDPQHDGYTYVLSARRRFERDQHCVLEAIPNVGIKRLAAREVINKGAHDLQHIHRSSRAGMRRQITLVPVEQQGQLDNAERIRFHAQLSLYGILSHVLRPKVARQLTEAVKRSGNALPVADTLRLFSGKPDA